MRPDVSHQMRAAAPSARATTRVVKINGQSFSTLIASCQRQPTHDWPRPQTTRLDAFEHDRVPDFRRLSRRMGPPRSRAPCPGNEVRIPWRALPLKTACLRNCTSRSTPRTRSGCAYATVGRISTCRSSRHAPRNRAHVASMPVKVPPDTSKFLLCPMPGLVVKVDVAEGRVEVRGGPGALPPSRR